MPDQDGWDLIRFLRANEQRTIPAVAVTAYAGPQHRAAALDAGFDAHVPKPIDPELLSATILDVFRLKAGSRPAGL